MLLIILVGYYYIKNGIYPQKPLAKVANDIASEAVCKVFFIFFHFLLSFLGIIA